MVWTCLAGVLGLIVLPLAAAIAVGLRFSHPIVLAWRTHLWARGFFAAVIIGGLFLASPGDVGPRHRVWAILLNSVLMMTSVTLVTATLARRRDRPRVKRRMSLVRWITVLLVPLTVVLDLWATPQEMAAQVLPHVYGVVALTLLSSLSLLLLGTTLIMERNLGTLLIKPRTAWMLGFATIAGGMGAAIVLLTLERSFLR